jgi:hypothetical protein
VGRHAPPTSPRSSASAGLFLRCLHRSLAFLHLLTCGPVQQNHTRLFLGMRCCYPRGTGNSLLTSRVTHVTVPPRARASVGAPAFDRGSSLFFSFFFAMLGWRLRFLLPIADAVRKRVLRKGYALRRRLGLTCSRNRLRFFGEPSGGGRQSGYANRMRVECRLGGT